MEDASVINKQRYESLQDLKTALVQTKKGLIELSIDDYGEVTDLDFNITAMDYRIKIVDNLCADIVIVYNRKEE